MNHDPINNPSHYAEGRQFEPIDVIEDWELNFRLANTVKYISRAGRKKDILEDLRKARWYLDREIASLDTQRPSGVQYDDVVRYYGETQDEKEAWPFEVTQDDWTDFWDTQDNEFRLYVTDSSAFLEKKEDILWDPSLGPVELSEKEIADILAKKALDQFEDAEIVATVEKRGFILGIKKDGSTCELGSNGRCV